MVPRFSARRAALGAACVYTLLAAAMGSDVLHSATRGVANDATDSLLNAAILAWNASHVPLTEPWWQFPAFAPTSDTLTFSEHLLGVSVIAAPIQWLTGSALAAYNLTVVLSFPLSAMAMFALVYRLTGRPGAAFLAGLAYGFAPYRAGQLGHVQMLVVCWAPLSLVGLHAYADTHRRRWLVLAGLCWLLQAAANLYLLVYFSLVVGLWVLWFVVARRQWRDLAPIAATFSVSALPLVPLLSRYITAHGRYGLSRPPEEVLLYGADIAAPLCASPSLAVWNQLRIGCGAEGELFVGAALVVLCAIGIARGRGRVSSTAAFYLTAALVAWTLSWGPEPRWLGQGGLPQGPFAWLAAVPGLDGLRVPARFWMMSVLGLSVAMGVMMAELLARWSGPSARAVVVLGTCGLAADGWLWLAVAPGPPALPQAAALRGLTVMDLPVGDGWRDAAAQFRAVVGGWRVVNGHSGYEPAYYSALRQASRDEVPETFDAFRTTSDLQVVVPEEAPRLRALVERVDSVLVDEAGGFRRYVLPRRPAAAPVELGTRLDVAAFTASCSSDLLAAMADDDERSRWQCGPQTADQEVTIDLGTPAGVGAVRPALGAFGTDFPRRLVVETSVEGVMWRSAWEGPVLGETIAAALADPRRVPLTIPFERRTARYIRLRQVGRDPTWPWSIAELEVWSGA